MFVGVSGGNKWNRTEEAGADLFLSLAVLTFNVYFNV